MVIQTVSTLALYCSRCGKIELHDISRFNYKGCSRRELLCRCGQIQAKITDSGHGQYLLDIPCLLCATNHKICINVNNFSSKNLGKIYCITNNLELGFIGDRRTIKETIDYHQHELNNSIPDMACDEYVGNAQIMFEALNKVHDIAECGNIYCHCGSRAITAEILSGGIGLSCLQCGAVRIVRAQSEADLAKIQFLKSIKIMGKRSGHQKR